MRAAELRGLLLERRSTDTGLLPEVRALLVMRRVTYSMRTAACGAIQALRATPPDTGCFKSSLTMERPPLGDLSFMAATERHSIEIRKSLPSMPRDARAS